MLGVFFLFLQRILYKKWQIKCQNGALFGVKHRPHTFVCGFNVCRLGVCIRVLRHVQRRVPHKILFNFRRDARFFQSRGVCVPQNVRSNGKPKFLRYPMERKAHRVV